MILDNIKNASLYSGLNPRIEAALEWLQSQDFSQLEPGKIDIKGDELYALVNEYNTSKKEERFWEAHRKYIDIQFIVSGSEMMGYAGIDTLTPSSQYDEEKDFCKLDGDGSFVIAKAGTFAIFYPQDAHMPNLIFGSSEPVKKVVVKVLI